MRVEVPYSNQPNCERSFSKFLQVHIQQARDKGFDDIVTSGRHHSAQQVHFIVRTTKHNNKKINTFSAFPATSFKAMDRRDERSIQCCYEKEINLFIVHGYAIF